MRPSLIPGLVAAAQKNADRGFPDVALFEVGQIFSGDRPEDQLTAASGVRRALAQARRRRPPLVSGNGEVDAFDAKADALAVLAAAGAPPQALQVVPGGPAWLHPGRSGTIQIGPQNVLGHFGELHPRALEALDAEGPLVGFEVILERIPEPKAKPTRAKPLLELSPFQPVSAISPSWSTRTVKAGDLVRAAQNVDRKLITGVTVFDVYEGKGIEPGKKSIAIAVTMQPREKTMTDEEIDALGGEDRRRGEQSAPAACCGGLRVTTSAPGHRSAIRKAIALDRLADRTAIRRDSIGPADHEGVELAVLAARDRRSPAVRASSASSKRRPANDRGSCLRSTHTRYASTPASIISRASASVGRCHSGNTGAMPVPASFCSR